MKLCYVENNFAYFTNDFENQWGDDWDDAPYEHNAGAPYEHDTKTEIQVVAYKADLETPAERFGINSPFSVLDINKKKTPWLMGGYSQHVEIYAGTSIESFCDSVIASGGEVFFKVEEEDLKKVLK